MSRAFRFARVATRRAPSQNGNRIGEMRLAVPAGTIGTRLNRVRIVCSGWRVRNDGGLAGYVGGRMLLQLAWKAAGIPLREDSIIDAGWLENRAANLRPQGRVTHDDLSASVSSAIIRRQIVWDPMPYLVAPGATQSVSFSLLLGIDLLAGMTDIDVVAIVERLPEVDTLAGGERRWPNAFSVAEAGPAGFGPILEGTPKLEVNPF